MKESNIIKEFINSQGQWHRDEKEGPAVEWKGGAKGYYLNGLRHRLNGPAIEYPNGVQFWFLNDCSAGFPHIEYSNGEKYWYIYGDRLIEIEYLVKSEYLKKTNPSTIYKPDLFTQESMECYLNLCETEISTGFDELKWKRIYVYPDYCKCVFQQLKSKYPQYFFELYDRTFIWIWKKKNYLEEVLPRIKASNEAFKSKLQDYPLMLHKYDEALKQWDLEMNELLNNKV